MKRLTIIVVLMLMGIMPMMAEHVTPETAKKVATTFLNNNGTKADNLTDLSKAAGFPNLYIFTSEQGFVVMSADDCVKPILGYSLTGGLIDGDMPSNMRSWLQGYNDEIQSAIDNQMKSSTETSKKWKDLIEGKPNAAKTSVVVAPLIQTKWNQNRYYNDLCPAVSDGINGHAYTGCVATAMAQIMKYWGYPSHGNGSLSYTWNNQTLSADFGSTSYDWDNMNDYYEYYTDDNGSTHWLPAPTSAELTAIATLMYHCGVSVSMIYGGNSTGGSSATNAAVASALKTYFNYSPAIEHKQKSYNSQVFYSNEAWASMVKAELNASRPLQYGGQDPNSNSGHAFVCDGYNSDNYFHFNWGWAGQFNGYFSLDNLDTGANSGQSGAGNGVYTRDQEAVFGIQPVQSTASEPTNLTYTLNGLQNITLSWTAVSGAASYNVYRNGNYIGNSNINSYTEIAPFGTNIYYVRSVDVNDNLSLSSNAVTVYIGYQTPVVDDLEASLSGNIVSLSWTEPEWCYPETPSETLTYGTQTISGTYFPFGNRFMYWGHRYLTNNISTYDDLLLYSVEFYTINTGSFELCIFEGSSSNGGYTVPSNLVFSQAISMTSLGWNKIDLSVPLIINGNQDLWVFIHNTEVFDNLSVYLCTAEGDDGVFYSENPTSYTSHNAPGYAFLIKTYLTDGTYTYNLYDGETKLNGEVPIADTFYTVQNPANNTAHQYTVKTNCYGGETSASNMAGFTLGSTSLVSLELGLNDHMVLTENSTLTISGTLNNTSPDNLILENGAQLIHNSEGVKATVKKHIDPYSADDNGWYFIASPVVETVTPSEENGFLNGTVGAGTNTYDLYYYNEPECLWKNYESEAFDIEYKKGYLYANGENEGTTLQFEGTLTPSNSSVSITNLSHSAALLNGFNLVGNPFACNATIDKDCYVIEGRQAVLANGTKVFAPCEGAFVQANSDDYSVSFTKHTEAKSGSETNSLDMIVRHDASGAFDRVRVRFGESNGLEKYTLDDKHLQLSLWKNGKDYAAASINGESELPLSFKTAQNGVYTLSIEANNLNLDYLHLIDNMTGDDVDLLITPNYTFEAKTSDYASRFRLVFSQNDPNGSSTGSETFAYVCDGNIIVSHEGNATLQIMDAAGRMVASIDDVSESVSTSNMPAGVYVLRLITDETVKTQKIVIE